MEPVHVIIASSSSVLPAGIWRSVTDRQEKLSLRLERKGVAGRDNCRYGAKANRWAQGQMDFATEFVALFRRAGWNAGEDAGVSQAAYGGAAPKGVQVALNNTDVKGGHLPTG